MPVKSPESIAKLFQFGLESTALRIDCAGNGMRHGKRDWTLSLLLSLASASDFDSPHTRRSRAAWVGGLLSDILFHTYKFRAHIGLCLLKFVSVQ